MTLGPTKILPIYILPVSQGKGNGYGTLYHSTYGDLPGQNGRLGHGGQENELLPKPVEAGEWSMVVPQLS
jgi:hypothetical protein